MRKGNTCLWLLGTLFLGYGVLNGQTSSQFEGPPNSSESHIRDSAATFLRAGDIIRLTIWRETDLSGDFIVDENGMVVFPKLGARKVTTIPTDSLRALLISSYQKFLENPSINVVFLSRIKVWGAVLKPGLYPVAPMTTITDAIAIAGGVSVNGRTDRVDLIRQGVRTTISLNEPAAILIEPIQSGDEIIVPTRSWISRNPTIIPLSLSALISIISLITR
jgi:protein involved in polysaccharide export with SLBB domain